MLRKVIIVSLTFVALSYSKDYVPPICYKTKSNDDSFIKFSCPHPTDLVDSITFHVSVGLTDIFYYTHMKSKKMSVSHYRNTYIDGRYELEELYSEFDEFGIQIHSSDEIRYGSQVKDLYEKLRQKFNLLKN